MLALTAVSVIGDALAPATIAAAVYAGHKLGREIDADPTRDRFRFERESHRCRRVVRRLPRPSTQSIFRQSGGQPGLRRDKLSAENSLVATPYHRLTGVAFLAIFSTILKEYNIFVSDFRLSKNTQEETQKCPSKHSVADTKSPAAPLSRLLASQYWDHLLLVSADRLLAMQAATPTLRLLMWQPYAIKETISAFESMHNAKFAPTFFDGNSEAFNKLKVGGTKDFDMVMADGFWPRLYFRQGLTKALDYSKIPNMSGVFADFLPASFKLLADEDGKNNVAAPNCWGGYGITVNTTRSTRQISARSNYCQCEVRRSFLDEFAI